MAKKIVRIPYIVWLNVELETDATDDDEIIEDAFQHAGLTGYAGNGGSGKLIGTSSRNCTVEACGEPYENEDDGIRIYVEDTN